MLPADPRLPRPSRLTRWLGHLLMWVLRWKPEGALPPGSKAILIASPHTSNWDFVYMLGCAAVLGVRLNWLAKHTMFKGPMGPIFRAMGGIAVDRTQASGMVEDAIRRFKESDGMVLAVPVSGTRSKARHWKSGFYHIARGAQIPVWFGYLDYRRRAGGIGPAFVPTGDVKADMDVIRAFYKDVTGLYPEAVTPVYLKEEAETAPESAKEA